ncbi:LysR family transcriptional regulator [Rhodobacter sp. Har01]|uniref:LysR family transcriptional regulator n=1 Tax=Rhodobacter sp. Har01 TaxID=2883999 RepID=UPI001D072627|nr:LysR family transcriptional regulator [Rhodobacter sp. Har01]MCB6177808.1 LysR family transcriptional regulator [Rhodobacter sp. Har01]
MNPADLVSLRQLRALASVVRTGSMTAAGRELGLTTPAVHSQIRTLEEALGLPLIHRHGDASGTGPTLAGQVMLTAAARMDAALQQAVQQVLAFRDGRAGRVTLGVVSTAKYFAPRLVKILRTLHPEIEVVLQVGNREEILADMERMHFDLAIMGRPPRTPPNEAWPIGPHPHGLIAPPDHQLAGINGLGAGDFAGETFIARERGSGTRILMMRYIERLVEGAPHAVVEMGSNETIKQAVMAGLGISFLSLHTVADELRNGSLVTLSAPGLPVERHWFLVRRLDQPVLPAAKLLEKTILGLDGSYLPLLPPAAIRPS